MDHSQLEAYCLREASETASQELKALLLIMAGFWRELAEAPPIAHMKAPETAGQSASAI